MDQWKLPSQLVITDRDPNESTEEMLLRHETLRRITAEIDLCNALDFIKELRETSSSRQSIDEFLAKFLDKTINN